MILFEFIIQINSVNVVLECHIHLYILLLYSTVKSDDNLNEAKREKKTVYVRYKRACYCEYRHLLISI
jgi:hypothetical protein